VNSPDTIRLIPKNPNPFEETMALIERLGWEPSENYSDELVEWRTLDGHTLVRWINSDVTGVNYFVVEGPDRQRVADEIVGAIDMLRVPDFESYLALSDDTQWVMRGLYAVAAAAPKECDPQVVELLSRYLRADDPLIRRVASLATGITGWPEFVEPVRRLLTDPDPEVRIAAQSAMESLPAER
jgi:hypothetical protein